MPYYTNDSLRLKNGSKGAAVKELQEDLIKLGSDIGGVDGSFGARTEKAVRSFQEKHFVSGEVDLTTAAAIHNAVAAAGASIAPALPEIPFVVSPNYSSRGGIDIDMLVIHFTANGSLDATINWFENPNASASAHYVIGKDGKIVQMVKEDDKAWHAGESSWAGVSDCNKFSIGIEVVNWGILKKKGDKFYCWPGEYTQLYKGAVPVSANGNYWEPYTDKQYAALEMLSKVIVKRHAIPLSRIVGHSDIAPKRKTDPGPAFDWARFKKNISA